MALKLNDIMEINASTFINKTGENGMSPEQKAYIEKLRVQNKHRGLVHFNKDVLKSKLDFYGQIIKAISTVKGNISEEKIKDKLIGDLSPSMVDDIFDSMQLNSIGKPATEFKKPHIKKITGIKTDVEVEEINLDYNEERRYYNDKNTDLDFMHMDLEKIGEKLKKKTPENITELPKTTCCGNKDDCQSKTPEVKKVEENAEELSYNFVPGMNQEEYFLNYPYNLDNEGLVKDLKENQANKSSNKEIGLPLLEVNQKVFDLLEKYNYVNHINKDIIEFIYPFESMAYLSINKEIPDSGKCNSVDVIKCLGYVIKNIDRAENSDTNSGFIKYLEKEELNGKIEGS